MAKSSSEFWILDGILYTQNKTRQVRRSHLRIDGGRIAEITDSLSPAISRKIEQGKVHAINAQGMTLIPGFVHAHIHLCQTLFRNFADDLELLDWLSKRIWVLEGAHTEETLYTSALLGIHELLSSGSTCILDMGTVRHTGAVYQAVKDSGIRANVGKCLMDNPKQTPEYLRDSTSTALSEADELYSKWHKSENDRIRASYAPRFAISCTRELLSEVALRSREKQALVHTHASENQKEIELVKSLFHRENIEFLHEIGLTSPRLVLAHCVWLNSKEKEILKSTGTHVAHCPSSNLKLASGIAPVPELRSMNINVALGADGSPCNNNLNMFQEMKLAAFIHKPGSGPTTLRAMEAMDMATRNGATALGWWDDIGSIEVGKKADLVALDLSGPVNSIPLECELNPEMIASSIVYATQPQHVRWTMVDGKIVFQDGKVTNIPTQDLMVQVRKAQTYFANRIF